MTFAWGAIGFILAGFSTGYIFIRATRIERFLPPLAGPFAFSLLINCVLVQAAAFTGTYTTGNARGFALLAVAVSLVLLLADRRLDLSYYTRNIARLRWLAASRGEQKFMTTANIIAVTLAAVSIVGIFQLLVKTSGSVITGFDPVAQWNPWAVEWASNHPPVRIFHYPQLVPILWSIPYATMGNASIEFFSSSFKFIFWLAIFETLIYLALRSRDIFLVISVPLASSLLRSIAGRTTLEDYIDVPVAMFALIAVAILLPPRMASRSPGRVVTAALLLASGAAMTKQVGLYMIGAVPLLVLCWEMDINPRLGALFRTAIGLTWRAALALALCASIYVYAEITIKAGTNGSELSYLFEEIYEQPSRIARALDGLRSVLASMSWLEIVAVFAGSIAVLWDRRYRWVLLVICIPFSILWAFFFSYDSRNVALTVPFWALTTAVGLKIILLRIGPAIFRPDLLAAAKSLIGGVKFANRWAAAALLIAAVAGLVLAQNKRFSEERLLTNQNQFAIERLAEGENKPTAQLMTLLGEIGNPIRIYSEWRWACIYHFTRNSDCRRIFPDEFFRAFPEGALDPATSVLIILVPASVDPTRLKILGDHGFVERPCYTCQDTARTFVRLRRS